MTGPTDLLSTGEKRLLAALVLVGKLLRKTRQGES